MRARPSWRSALALLAALPAAAGAAPLPPGAADSLLAQARRSHHAGDEGRAISIFEAYLESHPDDQAVRLDLANALAWSGDPERALPIYRTLLAWDSGGPGLLRSYADCLRWAGRDEESLDAYRLLPDPPQEADVRREIERLRRTADPAGAAESIVFHDSSEISAERHHFGCRAIGGSARGLSVSVGAERVRRSTEPAETATPWGRTAAVRASRSLGPARSIRLDAGFIDYAGGPAHPRLEMRLRFPLTRRMPAEIRAAWRDRAFDLRSVGAYAIRLSGLEGSGSAYASLGHAGGVYARIRGGRYSDENGFIGADVSCDAALLAGLRAAVAASGVDHAREAVAYYAGTREWSLAGHLILDRILRSSLHLRLDGWAGRMGNRHGRGETTGGRVDLAGPLTRTIWLRFSAESARSRQNAGYSSRLLAIAADWRP